MFVNWNDVFGEEARRKQLKTIEFFKRQATINKTCTACKHSMIELSHQMLSEKYYKIVCPIMHITFKNTIGFSNCSNWEARYPEYEIKEGDNSD